MELVLDINKPFNLEYSLDSGQLFRWTEKKNWRIGLIDNTVIKIKKIKSKLVVNTSNKIDEKDIRRYFRLDDNLELIIKEINRDEYINSAIKRFLGLRLIRQEPWECLISYLCSSVSNIPKIKHSIKLLTEKFGEINEFQNNIYYNFPTSKKLAKASINELTSCGLGFRARNISNISKKIYSGNFKLNEIKKMKYNVAFSHLNEIRGIGPKIADCVLLFAFEKLDAFPIDRWIARVIFRNYMNKISYKENSTSERISLSFEKYQEISSSMRKYFGKYSGYAQQYLYYNMINNI